MVVITIGKAKKNCEMAIGKGDLKIPTEIVKNWIYICDEKTKKY